MADTPTGKHLIRRLLNLGVPVTSIDIIFFDDELDDIHREIPQSKELFSVMYGDIRDEAALQRALTPDVTGVINLAAVSRVLWCLENQKDCEDVNVRGVDVVLEAMKRHRKEAWFIQASSREVYGSQEVLPVAENAPLTPANVYGSSKARAEQVVKRHVAERNNDRSEPTLHAIALRLSNVYGGEFDHRERLIPSIMTQAIAHRTIQVVGGRQDLDMVPIDDVIDAFLLAISRLEKRSRAATTSWPFAFRPDSELDAFNVASGASASVSELLGRILAITQSASPLQTIAGDDRFPDRYVGSTFKASAILNFTARVSLDEGIHRMADAYLRRTIDYLEHKISERCSTTLQYSVADLLNLDGCSGTVAAHGPGQRRYVYDTDEFGWRDDLEPQIWNFEVEDTDSTDPIFRFSRETSSETRYYEVIDEGPDHGQGETRFKIRLNPSTGNVGIFTALSGRPIVIPEINMNQGATGSGDELPQYQFRLTPYCCPGKHAPSPFYTEDLLASAIYDYPTEKERDFTVSRTTIFCHKLESARRTVRERLDKHILYRSVSTRDLCPLASPPNGNIAISPSASTYAIIRLFPFATSAHLDVLSYPPSVLDESKLHEPDVLVKQVELSNWLNVLRPTVARYLSRDPEIMRINLTRLPDDMQRDRVENAQSYDRLFSSVRGCFSADAAMERGVKLLSSEYSDDGLDFLPYYQGTKSSPPDAWFDNARAQILPHSFDESNLIIPFTFDWGGCNLPFKSLSEVRNHEVSVSRTIRHGTAWSVMGDLDSGCYRPDQDIVIPPHTCLQGLLRTHFGDMANVRPIRQRSILTLLIDSPSGVGASLRPKLECNRRVYHNLTAPTLEGGELLSAIWGTYAEGMDYLETLNNTAFCPLLDGTIGWAARTIDIIYAGCIPVLIGDRTHRPFWDMLDWTKFSIQVELEQLEDFEEILLRYSWSKLHQMQTNLMLIRDAFLYPADDDMGQHLRARGPLFFAMHATALLQQTKFPI